MVDMKPGEVERTEDFGSTPEASPRRWLAEIKAYEQAFRDWESRSERIIKRYKSERASENAVYTTNDRRLNLLWSNVQTLQPALYSRTPEPSVSRRHKDKDVIARAASVIMQRCAGYELEGGGLEDSAPDARDDYLLTARGQLWARYVPTYGDKTKDQIFLQPVMGEEGFPVDYVDDDGNSPDEFEIDESGNAYMFSEEYEPVVDECVEIDYINWRDFGHTPAPTWRKVRAVWKRELMTREQLIKRFGEDVGKAVGLTKTVTGISESDVTAFGDVFQRAEVFEIWDKPSRKVIWISPGYTRKALDEIDDPLGLEDFFPCPKPLYGTRSTDSLIPVPDYVSYQSQADDIDILTQRIHVLTKSLRVAGVYNGEFSALEKLLEGGENTMIPVDSWAAFAEAGGVDGAVSFMPIRDIAQVLQILTQTREQLKEDLYEITGISDIVRGQSDPRETLGAQRIKGRYAGLRLSERQKTMAVFIRDVVRIVLEIISEHFSDESILMRSGWMETTEAQILNRRAAQGVGPDAMTAFQMALQLIRDEKMRNFRIDIETDQLVLEDDERNKQERVEFLTSASQFLQQAVPAAEQFPNIGPLLGEMLMFGVRAFKAGRPLEASFEEAIELMASEQKKPESEEGEAEKADSPVDMMKAEADMLKAQAQQMRTEIEGMKAQMRNRIDEAKLQLEAQEVMLSRMKLDAESRDKAQAAEMERLKLALQSAEMIGNMDEAERDREVQREQIKATKANATSKES